MTLLTPRMGVYHTSAGLNRTAQATQTQPAIAFNSSVREMSLTDFIDRIATRPARALRFGSSEGEKDIPRYDVVIIGAGPAGVTAAVYAVRRKLKTLLLEKAPVIGGYVANTSIIENYPGTFSTTGEDLANQYKARLDKLNEPESGLQGLLETQLNKSVMKVTQEEDGTFKVVLDQNQGTFSARAVLIATGVQRKKVPIKGFQELLNKGVSMCTICDGPLYKDKDVAIIGHNQAAVDAALYMSTIAKSVYFVSPKAIEASADTLAALRAKPTVKEVLENTNVLEFKGTATLNAMVIRDANNKSAPTREIPLRGAFLETDLVSSAKFATGLIALDEQGQVYVDDTLNAGAPGLFAAGDVTPVKYKQITIAEGQGAIAALRAAEYLQGKDIVADYGSNSKYSGAKAKPPKPAG